MKVSMEPDCRSDLLECVAHVAGGVPSTGDKRIMSAPPLAEKRDCHCRRQQRLALAPWSLRAISAVVPPIVERSWSCSAVEFLLVEAKGRTRFLVGSCASVASWLRRESTVDIPLMKPSEVCT